MTSTTSSVMVAQFVSSTGLLVTNSLPFLWMLLGLFIAAIAVMLIVSAFTKTGRNIGRRL